MRPLLNCFLFVILFSSCGRADEKHESTAMEPGEHAEKAVYMNRESTGTIIHKIETAKPINQLNLLGTWEVIDTRCEKTETGFEKNETYPAADVYDILIGDLYIFEPDNRFEQTGTENITGKWIMDNPTAIRLDRNDTGEIQRACMKGNMMYWMSTEKGLNKFLFLKKVK